MYMRFSVEVVKRKKSVPEMLSNILKTGAFKVISASVILAVIMSCMAPKKAPKVNNVDSEKYKSFELVEARVLEDVQKNIESVEGEWVFNSSVPVDINGDGVKDFDLQLAIDRTSPLSVKELQMFDIKKDSQLILEGFVERDELNNKKSMKSFGNGVHFVKHSVAVDERRGAHYMDYRNIISIDKHIVNMPRNNDNLYDLNNLLNNKSR